MCFSFYNYLSFLLFIVVLHDVVQLLIKKKKKDTYCMCSLCKITIRALCIFQKDSMYMKACSTLRTCLITIYNMHLTVFKHVISVTISMVFIYRVHFDVLLIYLEI